MLVKAAQGAAPPLQRARTDILALDAQSGLLPYALAAFAVGVPLVALAGLQAPNAAWLMLCLGQAALNWSLFYIGVSWLAKAPARRLDVRRRTWAHLAGGVAWAALLAQLAVIADHAGPARETLLLLSLCGAVSCFFFTAPHLLSLLVIGPLAAGPALWFLNGSPEPIGDLAQGGAALAFALALIVNRLLRRSFDMAVEREKLDDERARALASAEILAAGKSALLTTLSEEVRTGLSAVVQVLSAASGPTVRSRPSRDQLASALDSARDLVALLDATLDSEQAETGRLTVSIEPLSPADLAREAVRAMEPAAAVKGLDLSVEILTHDGAVMADADRTRQILSNLLGNAVKYTARGSIALRVQAVGADRLRFEVSDSGPGLAEEELRLAFQPFKRIGRTAAGVPGAGLGLSLSRRLAELMKGEVGAGSAIGRGSRFWLELPYDAAAGPAESVRRLEAEGPLRVLVIEPDSLSAVMLRAALDQLGHRMLHTHDKTRGLDLLRSCEVDAVLVGGPEADAAVRALRALNLPAGRLRIAALLGSEAQDADACLRAGADAVLRKPVTVGAVARALAIAGRIPARAQAA